MAAKTGTDLVVVMHRKNNGCFLERTTALSLLFLLLFIDNKMQTSLSCPNFWLTTSLPFENYFL